MQSNGRPLVEFASIGLVLVGCVVIGYALGAWLDRSLGIAPWGVVLGVLLGMVAGFLNAWRAVKRS